MTSVEIRQLFFDFFASRGHTILPSAPIVIKDDPTLLFTNAGMNQFKDYFLGNKKAAHARVADTQKCLRVSGKHNDLEEVGVDTYHHTMFEMLGNWSFGNSDSQPGPYFKKEAIAWAWELLTKIFKIDPSLLYVTVFEGDEKEALPIDEEALCCWKQWVGEDHILMGTKKDNFWEMGDSGPCGPSTEIHIDTRAPEERKLTNGQDLVNRDHPQVIEIWNVVFIQYNRKKDGKLEPLPERHVDTGMGFERLVRVLQQKQSNYDTDIFSGTIAAVASISGKKYGGTDSKQDVAFRVISDHIRAIAFSIADGQMPSNTGAGYVIRRILRRAVRYYFSYLEVKEPMLFKLVPLISQQFRGVFPEIEEQQAFLEKVVHEEEQNFLRTLEKGLKRIEENFEKIKKSHPDLQNQAIKANHPGEPPAAYPVVFSGKEAFELYDTYGFPLDLTRLILEQGPEGFRFSIDEEGFEKEMQQQKNRSRAAGQVDTEDWVVLDEKGVSKFVGYESDETTSRVIKYRKTRTQGKVLYQIVLDTTPFYAESGGQVGDTGNLIFAKENIGVVNTKKENDLIIHFTEKLPKTVEGEVTARIDTDQRKRTAIHHSATHLLHAALRKVLGNHVQQKGSLVNEASLRFDFSHFAKVTGEQLQMIESIVNEKIRENIPVVIREMKKQEALATGAMALFGEKYGETVRVVIMDPGYSIELCGGTHVGRTGELGYFKITAETAVGAGIRRMEAVSGKAAEAYIAHEFSVMDQIKERLKHPADLLRAIDKLVTDNTELLKKTEKLEAAELSVLAGNLLQQTTTINGVRFLGKVVEVPSADALKKISFSLKSTLKDFVIILAANIDGKAATVILLDEKAADSKNLDAAKIIKEIIAPLIKGGGGGQKTLATAGGQDPSRLEEVISKVKALL